MTHDLVVKGALIVAVEEVPKAALKSFAPLHWESFAEYLGWLPGSAAVRRRISSASTASTSRPTSPPIPRSSRWLPRSAARASG